jgi:membrane protein
MDLLRRLRERMAADRIPIVAAGVAFYALMAIFPALIALVGVYGLLFDPSAVDQQIATLSGFLPQEAAELLVEELGEITTMDRTKLGLGSLAALLFALWSASGGMRTLMQALNIAYREQERRGTLRFYATALGLTLGAVVAAIVALSLVVAIPALIKALGLGEALENLIGYSRWPILAAAALLGFAVLYRYAPSRSSARWQWVSWGSAIATLLWLGASALFSLYVGNFADYNKTYGSMGAGVILLTWFLLTAYCILLGGEINAEVEHRRNL